MTRYIWGSLVGSFLGLEYCIPSFCLFFLLGVELREDRFILGVFEDPGCSVFFLVLKQFEGYK